MSASTAMLIAPKALQAFAERAKRGEADHYFGSGMCEFYAGNIVTSLISLDPPIGHQRKVSSAEMEHLKANATPRSAS